MQLFQNTCLKNRHQVFDAYVPTTNLRFVGKLVEITLINPREAIYQGYRFPHIIVIG